MKTQIRSIQLEEFFMLSSSHSFFFILLLFLFFSPLLSFLFLSHHWQILIGLFLSISFLFLFFLFLRQRKMFFLFFMVGWWVRKIAKLLYTTIHKYAQSYILFYFFPRPFKDCSVVICYIVEKKSFFTILFPLFFIDAF